jgi:hypothetical protein
MMDEASGQEPCPTKDLADALIEALAAARMVRDANSDEPHIPPMALAADAAANAKARGAKDKEAQPSDATIDAAAHSLAIFWPTRTPGMCAVGLLRSDEGPAGQGCGARGADRGATTDRRRRMTAELIARADAILAVKDAGKSMMPESPWEVMRAMRAALAAQAQQLIDDSPGTPLGRLNAIGEFAEKRGLCIGVEAEPGELFLMEAFDAQAQEIEQWKEQWKDCIIAQARDIERREAAEARVRELEANAPEGLRPNERLIWLLGDLMNNVENYYGAENPKRLGHIDCAAAKIIDQVIAPQLAAIEAATIERCAAIVGDHRVAARIRALEPS